MKKLLFAALLFTCVSASAGVMEEAKSLQDQFAADKTEYANVSATRAGLAKRYDDLKWTFDQVKKQADKFQTDRADLNMRMDSQATVIANHNSRCAGAFTDPGYVNSCNAEADQIDATSSTLNQENNSLEQTRSLIKEAIQTQTEETEKVAAQDKAAMDRQNELAADEQRIIDRLTQIKGQVDTCQSAIDAVDAHPSSDSYKERMHAACGSMFDGNK